MVFGVLLLVMVSVGASNRKQEDSIVEVDVSLDDLDSLGEALNDLSFEDLEGLPEDNGLGISDVDLDLLGEALNNLNFDDLEGITDN